MCRRRRDRQYKAAAGALRRKSYRPQGRLLRHRRNVRDAKEKFRAFLANCFRPKRGPGKIAHKERSDRMRRLQNANRAHQQLHRPPPNQDFSRVFALAETYLGPSPVLGEIGFDWVCFLIPPESLFLS